MLLPLILVICVTFAAFSNVSAIHVDFQFVNSLKNVLDIVGTDVHEHFVDEHARALGQIQNPQHKHFGKRHAFAVQISSDCTNACFQHFLSAFGEDNVDYIHPGFSVAYTTESELANYIGLTQDTKTILSYVPLVPASKISSTASSGCFDFNAQDENAMQDYEERTKVSKLSRTRPLSTTSMIVLKVAPMTPEELASFRETISSLVSEFAGDVDFTNQWDLRLMKPEAVSLLGLKVTAKDADCSKTKTLISRAAELREVIRVERTDEVFTMNRWVKPLGESFTDTNQAITVQGSLTGKGQIIGISDTGLDMSSCYFSDPNVAAPYSTPANPTKNLAHRKVIQYITFVDNSDDSVGHGTHVCGTAAGSPLQNYGDFMKYSGIAADAKIAFFDIGPSSGSISPPSDVAADLLQVQYNAGARIFANSWGSAPAAGKKSNYDSRCQNIDQWLFNHQDAFVAFAAGNEGDAGAGTVTSPGGAKNILTVGASLSSNDCFKAFPNSVPDGVDDNFNPSKLAYFSSQGPMLDGRIKPDLTAVGWWVSSAKATPGNTGSSNAQCNVQTLQGTSMATPAAGGFAAIVRQYLVDGYYPYGTPTASNKVVPMGALIKAILIHSAQQLTGSVKVNPNSGATTVQTLPSLPYPSSQQGYGRIQLNTVLNFGKPQSCSSGVCQPNNPLSLYLIGGNSTNAIVPAAAFTAVGVKQYYFKTGSAAGPVRITMTYYDYKYTGSSFTSASNMMNTLQLTAVSCGSGTVTGLDVNGGSCSTPGSVLYPSLTTIGTTVQMIDIQNAPPNTVYQIQVQCASLIAATKLQPFAVVATQNVISFPPGPNDNPYAPYSLSSGGSVASYINESAAIIISVFAVICVILLILAVIIYRAHKRADQLEKDEINAAVESLARRHREAQLSAAGEM